MTLMCIENSQSPTHNGTFLPGRKSPVKNSSSVSNNSNSVHQQNANNNNNSNHHHHHRRNSVSPPLSKSQPGLDSNNNHHKSHESSRKLERSSSEPTDRRVVPSNSSRYKTELCRPFEENGTCKYGDKCQFAHGVKELRSMARHPKYKTELCRTFHTSGLCPYGPRCHFIHNFLPDGTSLLSANLATGSAPPTRSSLGSAGDVSPPNTPTVSKSFSYEFVPSPVTPSLVNLNHPNFSFSPVDCLPEHQQQQRFLFAGEESSDSSDTWAYPSYGSSNPGAYEAPVFTAPFPQDDIFSRLSCFPRIPIH